MKKISLSLFTVLFLACGISTSIISEREALYQVLTQQIDGGANIRFFEILTEPNEIRMLQNDEKLKNKINPVDVQKSNFVILNMGEKNTAGYSIGIDSVVETEKNIIISVKESNPEPDSMIT
jgi:hypothetical protein